MWVYGDRSRARDPQEMLAEICAGLLALKGLHGMERHAALVSAFINASELAQGLADAAFQVRGCDGPSPEQDAAIAVLTALARAVIASWLGAPDSATETEALDRLAALGGLALPGEITTKTGEGYAFYALYPEAYAEAARSLAPAPDMRVIGLRSIGAGLAAMVAAALGAPPPITLRPTGHPFRRELKLSPELRAELLGDREARFAVVDEGPGLSGSSLNAVADLLEDQGVGAERIVFFPGHGGDLGGQASERHLARWTRADRRLVRFDELIPPERLADWAEDLIGCPITPVEDLSGGAWRGERFAEPDWPAADTFQERRKFRVTTAAGAWLLKFVGLGESGEGALRRARLLAGVGFVPEAVGLRHGFLVQRWIEGARVPDRARLLQHLPAYLGFRARALPAEPASGASVADLFEMMRTNVMEALGGEAPEALERWRARIEPLNHRVRRVETDNRLHAFEWLETRDGALLKADAVEHAHGHDLIGCQDIAWDVAGAVVEYDLDWEAGERLRRTVADASGREVDPELTAFCEAAYAAFQLGAYAMAADAHGHWPAERQRLASRRDRYARWLREQLAR